MLFSRKFLGAMYSELFIRCTTRTRYLLVRNYCATIRNIPRSYINPPLEIDHHLRTAPQAITILDFEKNNELLKEKVALWTAWPVSTQSENTLWLNLLPLFNKFGSGTAEKFHRSICKFANPRKLHAVKGVTELCIFLSSTKHLQCENDFHANYVKTSLWEDFLKFYLISGFKNGNGVSIEVLTKAWNHQIIKLANSICNDGLLAFPILDFPRIPIISSNVTYKEINGSRPYKALTDIPLNISDEKALRLLCDKIADDVHAIRGWAESMANGANHRYMGRPASTLYEYQCPDKHVAALKFPEYLMCTTNLNIRPKKLTCAENLKLKTNAFDVGLPNNLVILAHCVLLVYHHPEITPSFLENLKLPEGTGHHQYDVAPEFISGFKFRKGHRTAQQIIHLNDTTKKIISRLIKITSFARRLMFDTGCADYRYLLLTMGSGFATPRRVKRLATITSDITPQIKCSFQNYIGDDERSAQLLRRLSLRALRSSVAIILYFKTTSVAEMARALGHTTLDSRLIQRYLPYSIQQYFQQRWIRIFQAGIILEAMKQSPFLLEASEFRTLNAIDAFLTDHCHDWIHISSELKNSVADNTGLLERSERSIIVGVSPELLNFFLRLQVREKSRNDLCFHELLILNFGNHVIDELHVQKQRRPDLYRVLVDETQKIYGAPHEQ